jgi:outer membrane protein
MNNLYKIFFCILILLNFENKAVANDVYFIDFAKVMNESKAGKKAQDYLKKELQSSNKKLNDSAKKLKEEENKIISQKNVLSKEEYKKKADELRKKVSNLNKTRQDQIKNIASMRKKAKDELFKALNPILGKYMEENNITVIIDKKNVLMGNKKFELTSPIIEILNKELNSINLK